MEANARLSLEQEFILRVFGEEIKTLNLQEAQECLVETLRQSMVKENLFRELFKNSI